MITSLPKHSLDFSRLTELQTPERDVASLGSVRLKEPGVFHVNPKLRLLICFSKKDKNGRSRGKRRLRPLFEK